MFYRSGKWKSEDPEDTKCVGTIVPTAEDCYKETVAQLERHKELTGKYPIHFEGHSVITTPIREAFERAAKEFDIHGMTTPEEGTEKLYPSCELAFYYPDYFPAIMRGTRPEDFFEDRLGLLKSPFEINIMHFHPGYLDQDVFENSSLTIPRCIDLATLCDPQVREWLEKHDIELVDFRAVYK